MELFVVVMFFLVDLTLLFAAIQAIWYLATAGIGYAVTYFVRTFLLVILEVTFLTIFVWGPSVGSFGHFYSLYSRHAVKTTKLIFNWLPIDKLHLGNGKQAFDDLHKRILDIIGEHGQSNPANPKKGPGTGGCRILALYTMGETHEQGLLGLTSGKKLQRIFRIGEQIDVNVVIYNTSKEAHLKLESGDITIVCVGGGSGKSYTATNQSAIDIPESKREDVEIKLDIPDEFNTWSSGGYEFVGQTVTGELQVLKKKMGKIRFCIDEFGVPDWLTRANAVVIGGLGASHVPPFVMYDESKWAGYLSQAKAAGMGALFIGPEYYNYGTLEGGLSYERYVSKVVPLPHYEWEETREPYMSYWFPTGPREGTYDYTTPSDKMGGADIEQKRDLIRKFVDRAHASEYGIKIIAYMDCMGIYDPETEVSDFENDPFHRGISSSRKAHYLDKTSWVRIDDAGNPLRLTFTENMLDLDDPDKALLHSEPPNRLALRELNPDDYGLTPSFQISPNEDSKPCKVSIENMEGKSYREYMAKQVAWIIHRYDFDGIFLDDIGRVSARIENITVPAQGLMAAGLTLVTAFNCTFDDNSNARLPDPQFNYYEHVFGCDPARSDFAYGMNGETVHASLASFLRQLRYQIKTWGGDEKALISSDYFVPWQQLATVEDASSTDQHIIGSTYNAEWCHHTSTGSFKPMRLDYNPRTKVGSEDVNVTSTAVAWANGAVFWFGGDNEATRPILTSLEDGTLSSSKYATYALFHESHHEVMKPLYADLIYNSRIDSLRSTRKLKITSKNADDSEPYMTMWSVPGESGEDCRILHLINMNSGANVKACKKFVIRVGMPVGQRVRSVRLLSPDYDDHEQTLQETDECGSGIGCWGMVNSQGEPDANGSFQRIVLTELQIYSVIVIEYQE